MIETDCDNWKRLWIKNSCMNFSSNTNEVIRAVLNPLKAQKAQKSIKSIKSTKTQPSKRTKTQISEQK